MRPIALLPVVLLAVAANGREPVSSLTSASAGAGPRCRELFDFDWRFHAGDAPDASQSDFDDAAWQPVDLPHDWQIAGSFDEATPDGVACGYLPHGIGWYRKHFTVPANLAGKRFYLDFEGVYRASDVWLNGQHLGKKLNGYIGFQYDITPHLRLGEPNVIAVRCDNSADNTSRWYTGSGIYRHVWLLATDPLHVERFGTYVTTPRLSDESATVRILTEVRNHHTDRRPCELVTEILDPDGRSVASARAVVPVLPGDTFRFDQELTVSRPALWSVDTPVLYTAVSRIREAGILKDVYQTPFGIREITINPEAGLLLNGRKVLAKGVNIHHDNGCLGAAAFDRAIKRRLEILKAMGCNAIRLSHNPHAPALLDLCDRMGLLVFDEAYDKWTGQFNGFAAPFEQTWKADLLEFLRRDRNHPSVFLWSVGNECTEQQIDSADRGVGQLRELVDYVHAHEPTRKVTCALYPTREDGIVYWMDPNTKAEDKAPTPMTFYMDVTSCNYMEQLFAHDQALYPQLVFVASEVSTNGAGRDWFKMDKAHNVGLFYWGGIDYLGESFGWPNKAWFRGFVDLCGFRKSVSYFVQSLYADEPFVRLAVYDTKPGSDVVWNDVKLTWRPIEEHWSWQGHARVTLATYTNCETVELLLNGRPLGEKRLADCKERLMEWDVPFEPGTLRAVGRVKGVVVSEHELRTAGQPDRITLVADRSELQADGQDLAHITVQVTDRDGVVVPSAAGTIRFTVTGAGHNAGVDNGDTMSGEPYQANERSVWKGKALLVVRAARKPGPIAIEATSPGLTTGRLELSAEAVGRAE
ncbi:MAG: DUF4982 domain-containing protein [Phycisphaerae bacterium]|nr:DUF4982 domain-containing protein [Phycisphaerae bacterium]